MIMERVEIFEFVLNARLETIADFDLDGCSFRMNETCTCYACSPWNNRVHKSTLDKNIDHIASVFQMGKSHFSILIILGLRLHWMRNVLLVELSTHPCALPSNDTNESGAYRQMISSTGTTGFK